MSDYRLEFNSIVGPNDTDRLNYLLSIVAENDELEITMDNNDKEQVDSVMDILSKNEFEVQTKGGHEGDKYHIIAHRKQ